MKTEFSHKLNIKKISKGLGLSEAMTIEFLDDGRIIGRLGEFIYAHHTGGKKQNENAKYDILLNGDKVEVRSVAPSGLSFAAAKETGQFREVTEEGKQEKLDALTRYSVIDYRDLSTVEFIEITKEDLDVLEEQGMINSDFKITQDKFHEYYDNTNSQGELSEDDGEDGQ